MAFILHARTYARDDGCHKDRSSADGLPRIRERRRETPSFGYLFRCTRYSFTRCACSTSPAKASISKKALSASSEVKLQ